MSLEGWDENKKIQLTIDSALIDADLTDLVIPILLSANERPESVDDDFTGTDGDAPDELLWERYHDEAEPALEDAGQIKDNQLAIYKTGMTIVGAYSTAGVKSKFAVGDNFDFDLDFVSFSANTTNAALFVADGESYSLDDGVLIYHGANLSRVRKYVGGTPTTLWEDLTGDLSGSKISVIRTDSSLVVEVDGVVKATHATFGTDNCNFLIYAGVSSSETAIDARFDNFVFNSGTIVWPESIPAGSGQTSFDMSAPFDALTPINVDDDFTGTDSDAPDVRLWDNILENGTSEIYSNKLRFDVQSAISRDKTVSRFKISGDFSIQVAFDIVNLPSADIGLIRLMASTQEVGTDDVVYVDRRYHTTHAYASDVKVGGVGQDYTTVATADDTGKFLLVRSGTTATAYYWNGSDWTAMASYGSWITDDVFIVLEAQTTAAISVTFDLDNLVLNSGTVIWDETPKKIAFEIDDTGVECFAEIVNWDYNNLLAHIDLKVPATLSAIDTVLNFYYDPTHADNVLVNRGIDQYTVILMQSDTTNGDPVVKNAVNGANFSGGCNHETAQAKIGATSLRFPGNQREYIDEPDTNLGSSDFTIEWWDRASYRASGKRTMGRYYGSRGWFIWLNSSIEFELFIKHSSGTSQTFDSNIYQSLNTWMHVAIVREGSSLRFYKNGVLQVTRTISVAIDDSTGLFTLGASYSTDSEEMAGWLDEVRIDVGIARYNANFTPTTVHFEQSLIGYIGDTGSEASDEVHSDRVFCSHQAQDPTGSILDSSPNAKHGTAYGAMTSDDLIEGLTGKMLDYDSVDDYTNHGYDAAHNITDVLTIRLVFKPSVLLDSSLTDAKRIISRQGVGSTDDSFSLHINTEGQLQLGSQGGNIKSTKASWNAGSRYVVVATYNATGLTGDLFVNGIKEVLSSDALDAMAGSTADLLLAYGSTAEQFFPGGLDEIIIVNAILSDAWAKADNAALRDDLIIFSEPVAAALLVSALEMLYGDLIAQHAIGIEMPFSILFPYTAFLEQVYGIKLEMGVDMYYEDASSLVKLLAQNYGNNPLLAKRIEMKYEDMLPLVKHLEMPYIIRKALQQIMEARYSLAGEPLVKALEQSYILLDNFLVTKGLAQPYMLQEGQELKYVTSSVVIGGRVVSPHHVNIEYSRDSFVASGEIHLSRESEYAQIEQGDDFEITLNGEIHVLIVESPPKRARRGAANTVFVVEGVSPAIRLTAPWSDLFTCVFDPDTAKNIFEALADPITVDWQIIDFPILQDTLYANNEDKISVMRKITKSVGAIIQSNPDGSLRVMYKYPTAVNQWADTAPDYFLTDSRHFVSQDETFRHNSGFNRYQVSNAATPEDRIWPVQDDNTIKMFEVPWKNTPATLTHSGGSGVITPEYLGVVEETIVDENVEFKAGFAISSKPVYGNFQATWIREQLGAITYSEDGRLEAEVKDGATEGYSLADISYTTKYKLWKIDNGTECDVQYLLRVEVDEQDSSQSCS